MPRVPEIGGYLGDKAAVWCVLLVGQVGVLGAVGHVVAGRATSTRVVSRIFAVSCVWAPAELRAGLKLGHAGVGR